MREHHRGERLRLAHIKPHRNQSEYRSKAFGAAEIAEAIDNTAAIRAACAGSLLGDHEECSSTAVPQ